MLPSDRAKWHKNIDIADSIYIKTIFMSNAASKVILKSYSIDCVMKLLPQWEHHRLHVLPRSESLAMMPQQSAAHVLLPLVVGIS